MAVVNIYRLCELKPLLKSVQLLYYAEFEQGLLFTIQKHAQIWNFFLFEISLLFAPSKLRYNISASKGSGMFACNSPTTKITCIWLIGIFAMFSYSKVIS